MSLGATTSAPASTWLTAVRASSSSVSSFDDLAVAQHAAVAVARVLAEADVRDQGQAGSLRPKRTQRTLDDPVVVPGARALLVLLLRDAEEEQRPDTQRPELDGLADQLVDGELGDRRKTLDRIDDAFARAREERHHEAVEVDRRLAHERT